MCWIGNTNGRTRRNVKKDVYLHSRDSLWLESRPWQSSPDKAGGGTIKKAPLRSRAGEEDMMY